MLEMFQHLGLRVVKVDPVPYGRDLCFPHCGLLGFLCLFQGVETICGITHWIGNVPWAYQTNGTVWYIQQIL